LKEQIRKSIDLSKVMLTPSESVTGLPFIQWGQDIAQDFLGSYAVSYPG